MCQFSIQKFLLQTVGHYNDDYKMPCYVNTGIYVVGHFEGLFVMEVVEALLCLVITMNSVFAGGFPLRWSSHQFLLQVTGATPNMVSAVNDLHVDRFSPSEPGKLSAH